MTITPMLPSFKRVAKRVLVIFISTEKSYVFGKQFFGFQRFSGFSVQNYDSARKSYRPMLSPCHTVSYSTVA